ncbi:MAG: TrmH family RNA methyltransferase [Candidatus Magasanikbacteria bacterium]|nr:TrmH family RNA methyltransferase [Candidatus Magasanikbacteria bacterium]MBT5263161.1 TrmH family RNA methyltransferase [Candidatus Magasanikbacteria bacterium]MBT5820611.1 TrmH family RNA methyltransferase [Candidatus Magasanikbacteria bacterium]MBT6294643.1 TrmH family RNA methyltransferase [Candidatus Magasanikbacteria bacterium]
MKEHNLHPLYLILPNIRSCHNVGAMFRNADAFGIEKIYLVGWTPAPPKPQIDKVALGAETWIPWEQRKSLKRLITTLKKKGVVVAALEQSAQSVSVHAAKITAPTALIVGNEVTGVAPEILSLCDVVYDIPMCGKKESLNVSVAAGIALFSLRNNQ